MKKDATLYYRARWDILSRMERESKGMGMHFLIILAKTSLNEVSSISSRYSREVVLS